MKPPVGVNLHVYPSPILNESRIFKETLAVAGAGLFSEVIVCGTRSHGLNEIESLDRTRRIERVGQANSERKKSVLRRIIGQIRWSLAVYQKYSRCEITVVNAHSVAVLPVCRAIARKHHARLIYDTHELETETSTSLGVQRRIFKIIERRLISRCDAVFVVSESIAEWYRSHYSSIDPVVIRNIPGVQRPGNAVDMRENLSVPEKSRLYIHVGHLGNSRHIDLMLDTFASTEVDDHIVFLGSGNHETLVQETAAKHANIHWMPPVPPEEVVSLVSGCDIGLCLIETNSLSCQLALPNKAMEYIAASIPFFFSNLVEVSRVLGPGFEQWQLNEPAEQLLPAVLGMTDHDITAARHALRAMDIPTWEQEVIPMLAKYHDLVS